MKTYRFLTTHQKAHELRRRQMQYAGVGYQGQARSCDGFLPTPRHLHGGVEHSSRGWKAVKKAEHGYI